MRTPADVLTDLLRSDPARPRLTWYDDAPGPTQGERIELSARVLGNWVSKAANALQDEYDVEPGRTVRLAVPPHWRTVYWALGTWSVGGCVDLDGAGDDPALTVSDDPAALTGLDHPGALVTLPALARSATTPVPDGAMDEARELATYGDQFSAWEEPAPDDPAVRARGGHTAYADVVPEGRWERGARLHTASPSVAEVLDDVLAAFAVDGSVVLGRGELSPEVASERLRVEGVTVRR